MNMELAFAVCLLGLAVSFLSGLLGIGGGVVMTPLLLYLPSLLGIGHLGIREVAGLTMVQGFVGALSGLLRHRSYGFVHKGLVLYMGSTIALSSLAGAVISKYASQQLLLAVFGLLALVGAGLMLLPKNEAGEKLGPAEISFNRPVAVLMATSVGFLGGLVGQGGAFILIPLMLYVLRLPTRITIGSSLGIVFFSALAGLIGKAGTGQVDSLLAVSLALGAIPGAQLGGYVSKTVSTKALRGILAALVALTALNIWYALLAR